MYSLHWEEYNTYYGYDKKEYDIETTKGDRIFNCYPNAGRFESHNPKTKGKIILEEEVRLIRFSHVDILGINDSKRKLRR